MIDWKSIKYFVPAEFPDDPDDHADPILITKLNYFRKLRGLPIYPSPVEGALARFDDSSKSSFHYAGEGFKSRAIDFYCEGTAYSAFIELLSSQLFGGIGVYFNAKYNGVSWVRFHVDLRKLGEKHAKDNVLIWYVNEDGDRYYPQYDKEKYLEMLCLFMKNNKWNRKGA